MDFAKIEITFNQDLSPEAVFNFYGLSNSFQSFLTETFRPTRTGANIASLNSQITSIPGESTAIGYLQAIALDYSFYPFTFSRSGNIVSIVSNSQAWTFAINPFLVNPPGVTTTIDNNLGSNLAYINHYFEAATINSVCSHIKVVVESSEVPDLILSPVADSNPQNPFSFEVARAQSIIFKASKGFAEYEKIITLPSVLNTSVVSATSQIDPANGNLLTINNTAFGLVLEYSLDNITFQTGNTFPNLLDGSVTIYVRDQFGCLISFDYVINPNGLTSPYANVPLSNPIRYALRVAHQDCGNYKNDLNTLSCESDVLVPYKQIIKYQTCDNSVVTQIESNYETNTIKTIDKITGNEINIPVVEIQKNIGLEDSRDALWFDYGGGLTGIYFSMGNIYDFLTQQQTGLYSLFGALPEWALEGNFVQINSIWYQIQRIVFDDIRNAECFLINTGLQITSDQQIIVKTKYNRFNFNVYEAKIDMVNYQDSNFSVAIKMQDPVFPEINYLSEEINVKVRQTNTKFLQYSATTNTDLIYANGLVNYLRLQVEKNYAKPIEETENYKTDSSVFLLKSNLHKAEVFEFSPVTKQYMWIVCQALIHDTLNIDGIDYVLDQLEVSDALEDTNLYEIKATLINKQNVFDSNTGSFEFNTFGVSIPGLLETDSGYISY